MRVRILKGLVTSKGIKDVGNVVSLPDKEASQLIAARSAIQFTPREAATTEPAETAIKQPSKSRTKRAKVQLKG